MKTTRRTRPLNVMRLFLARFDSGNIGLCLVRLGCSMNDMSRGVYSVIRMSFCLSVALQGELTFQAYREDLHSYSGSNS